MQTLLADRFGRQFNYLRISLTEACNFRCVYCTPAQGLPVLPPSHCLTREEIVRFVKVAARVGIRRVRLTGGEPLLRADLVEIVRDLKKIPDIRDVSITTNGSLLAPKLAALKEAGLNRINFSLDSLDPERFKKITLSDAYREVMEAAFQALKLGFEVKLNMVVLSDLTEEEVVRFVGLARDYPLEVRFLEFMPLCGEMWDADKVLPIAEVRRRVFAHFNLEELARGDDVAQTYRISGGKGKVGFIASLTESFCDQCSRMRLTADGRIRPCLFSEEEVSVKDLLRNQASDENLLEAMRRAAHLKPRGNQFREKPFQAGEEVLAAAALPRIRQIGG